MAIKFLKSKMAAQGSMSVTVTMRTLLARTYLQGGKRFSELARSMKRETSDPLYVAYVTGAIFLSVAALEAAVNAVWVDTPEKDRNSQEGLFDKCRQLLKVNKKDFNANSLEFKRVNALVKLRNALIHYKSDWDDNPQPHEQLKRLFKQVLSPKMLPQSFPKEYLLHDVVIEFPIWCCEFAVAFFRKMEMPTEVEAWEALQET